METVNKQWELPKKKKTKDSTVPRRKKKCRGSGGPWWAARKNSPNTWHKCKCIYCAKNRKQTLNYNGSPSCLWGSKNNYFEFGFRCQCIHCEIKRRQAFQQKPKKQFPMHRTRPKRSDPCDAYNHL